MQLVVSEVPFFVWKPFRIYISGRDADEKDDGDRKDYFIEEILGNRVFYSVYRIWIYAAYGYRACQVCFR